MTLAKTIGERSRRREKRENLNETLIRENYHLSSRRRICETLVSGKRVSRTLGSQPHRVSLRRSAEKSKQRFRSSDRCEFCGYFVNIMFYYAYLIRLLLTARLPCASCVAITLAVRALSPGRASLVMAIPTVSTRIVQEHQRLIGRGRTPVPQALLKLGRGRSCWWATASHIPEGTACAPARLPSRSEHRWCRAPGRSRRCGKRWGMPCCAVGAQ